jgi:hypothetical protein
LGRLISTSLAPSRSYSSIAPARRRHAASSPSPEVLRAADAQARDVVVERIRCSPDRALGAGGVARVEAGHLVQQQAASAAERASTPAWSSEEAKAIMPQREQRRRSA